jgi:AcrR family transcriptional regulator
VPAIPSADRAGDGDRDGAGPGRPVRPGRPRRYEAAEERQRLLDAGFGVIGRRGYGDATVADILAEAGVSTRSFYRHFASKDELLHALFRRDTERFAATVADRVAVAPAPPEALVVWIDEILGFGLDRPRARAAAVLGTDEAMRSLAPGELRAALDRLVAPLASALAAGAEDGSLPGAEPVDDAPIVSDLAWATVVRLRAAESEEERRRLRAALLGFVGRTVGVALESSD